MITVINLRKIFTEQGIKGASKWKREDFESAIIAAEFAAIAENATRKPVVAQVAKIAKGMCNVCGKRKAAKWINGQCTPCFEEGGWENTHNDGGHEEFNLAKLTEKQAAEVHGCWICYPELNLATRPARAGRSRLGMEIVAKGTEIHKSATFKVAAEAAGWTVTITTQDYEDGDETNTRHFADAVKDGNAIQLAWDGRAYDYPNSSARLAGKDRKVRNLKEALRLL